MFLETRIEGHGPKVRNSRIDPPEPSPSLTIVNEDSRSALRAIFRQKTDGELLALSKNPVLTAEEEVLIHEELRMRVLQQAGPKTAAVRPEDFTRKEPLEQRSGPYPSESYQQYLDRLAHEAWVAVRWRLFLIVLLIGGFIFAAAGGLDSSLDPTGWVSHRLKTDVLIHHEWLPGEVRECEGDPKVSIMCSNNPLENVPWAAVWSLGDSHTFMVTFWGRVDRGIETGWSCTRGETDLVCRATD